MKNILKLIAMDLKGYTRKLLYDFSREIVVITSTCVLCALFFYIFGDFISEKLKSVPESKVQMVANYVAIAFIFVSHFFWYKLILSNKLAKDGLYSTFQRIGQEKLSLQIYLLISFALESMAFFTLFDMAVNKWIYQYKISAWLFLELTALPLIPICYFLNSYQESRDSISLKTMNFSNTKNALFNWRYYQILFRNRSSQACLTIAYIFSIFLGYVSFFNINSSALVLLAMIISLALSWTLAFQLQEDMNHSWIEKILGVSQSEMETSYLSLALIFGLPATIIIGTTTFLSRADISLTLQLMTICLTGPLCFNAVMFQIDPRRPLIQILSSTLIVIFLGTAIFAHPLAIVLIPVLIHYGKTHQIDQFYTY